MLKRLYVKAQSIWKPRKEPLVMSHDNKNVLTAKYLDPKKVAKILNEMLGEAGWSKMEASVENARRQHLKGAQAKVHNRISKAQPLFIPGLF